MWKGARASLAAFPPFASVHISPQTPTSQGKFHHPAQVALKRREEMGTCRCSEQDSCPWETISFALVRKGKAEFSPSTMALRVLAALSPFAVVGLRQEIRVLPTGWECGRDL